MSIILENAFAKISFRTIGNNNAPLNSWATASRGTSIYSFSSASSSSSVYPSIFSSSSSITPSSFSRRSFGIDDSDNDCFRSTSLGLTTVSSARRIESPSPAAGMGAAAASRSSSSTSQTDFALRRSRRKKLSSHDGGDEGRPSLWWIGGASAQSPVTPARCLTTRSSGLTHARGLTTYVSCLMTTTRASALTSTSLGHRQTPTLVDLTSTHSHRQTRQASSTSLARLLPHSHRQTRQASSTSLARLSPQVVTDILRRNEVSVSQGLGPSIARYDCNQVFRSCVGVSMRAFHIHLLKV